MDLKEAEMMARRLIAEHLDTRWSFKWDSAKTRLGACLHRNHTITLSKHFTALNGEEETRDTVLHEIAHALTPGAAHGPAWKKVASRIGARPVARADGQTLVKPVANWVAQCPRCATTVSRYRRSSTPVACARCCNRHSGGRFDPRFTLSWAPADFGPSLHRSSIERDIKIGHATEGAGGAASRGLAALGGGAAGSEALLGAGGDASAGLAAALRDGGAASGEALLGVGGDASSEVAAAIGDGEDSRSDGGGAPPGVPAVALGGRSERTTPGLVKQLDLFADLSA